MGWRRLDGIAREVLRGFALHPFLPAARLYCGFTSS
jgi:hypothetical protein